MASIVLVDDEQNFLLATGELLRAYGHSVRTADTLAAARTVLANTFLQQLNQKHGTAKTLSDAGKAHLQAWHWPGNLRELKHCIHRSFVSSVGDGTEIVISDRFAGAMLSARPASMSPGRSIQNVERELIMKTLEHYSGDKKAAAETLGISLKTLYNRLVTRRGVVIAAVVSYWPESLQAMPVCSYCCALSSSTLKRGYTARF